MWELRPVGPGPPTSFARSLMPPSMLRSSRNTTLHSFLLSALLRKFCILHTNAMRVRAM